MEFLGGFIGAITGVLIMGLIVFITENKDE